MLVIGSVGADSGMSKAIFDAMDPLLSQPLQKALHDAQNDPNATAEQIANLQEALDKARDGWRKLSFAIATGVIGHLTSNLEINGVQTAASPPSAPVSGESELAAPGPHQHQVNLAAALAGVTFTQSNDGVGRVA